MLRTKTACTRTALLWTVAAALALAVPAGAVVPGLAGPLQALAQLLPQLLPFVAAGIAGLLSIRSWRQNAAHFGRWLFTPAGMLFGCAVLGLVAGLVYLDRNTDRSQIAVAASTSAPSAGPEWVMFRANPSRTGTAVPAPGPLAGRVHWSFSDPEARVADLSSSPAVVGNRVYIGSAEASVFDRSGMIYCVDATTGKQVWRFQTEKQVFSSPSVVAGRVYVGEGLHEDSRCNVYCLDAATGKKLWEKVTKDHVESSPAVVGGRVYVGAGEDGVYCLDAVTGRQIWHYVGAHVDADPVLVGGKVLVGTGYVKLGAMALEAATGKVAWFTKSDLPVWGSPAVMGGRAYYGTGNGDFVKSSPTPRGSLWCLDVATGREVWRQPLPDAVVTAVTALNGRAYAGCRDGKVYAVDAATGKIAWSAALGGPVVASPATDGKHLYAAGGDGQLHCLSLANGQSAWMLDVTRHTEAGVNLLSSPALGNGRLYLGTSKQKLLCIGP